MGTLNTSDFRKGMKIQIDGVPFVCIEMNFRKPGKGTALYECKLKNLLRNTVVDRTYRAGQTLEEADVMEFTAQYLYRSGTDFVFMNNQDYEQYELSEEQVGDDARFLKENMDCQVMTFNDQPIAVELPKHVVLQVEFAEPAPQGQHGHGRHQTDQARNGRRDPRPRLYQHRRLATGRHPHGRVRRTDHGAELNPQEQANKGPLPPCKGGGKHPRRRSAKRP